MRLRLLPLAACCVALSGCHSHYVEADVSNRTNAPIELLEVDYPSASFGTQNLAPGATFHYRFKVLGSGSTKLLYTDAAHKDHTSAGPDLKEGDEGRLTIDLNSDGAVWHLTPSQHP